MGIKVQEMKLEWKNEVCLRRCMEHGTKRLAIQDIVWKIKQVEIPQQNGQNLTKK
jgi:hypothetical protein